MGGLTIDERERRVLAPYAVFSRQSRGRRYPEPEHAYRGPFQRDRDRIVHSAAFRRLAGKMQVFTGDMGDYHRTRLTHTQEVASIARTMSRPLQLNEDLVEALALFHDIGHPPYGHAGEEALAAFLADEGGFSHNAHALTIAEVLEHPYAEFPGLNLTWEVLESQRARVDKASSAVPCLEAQIVDAADSIAYDAHDVDDAIKLKILSLESLSEVGIIRDLVADLGGTRGRSASATRRMLVRRLIDWRVGEAVAAFARQLERARPASAEDVKRRGLRLALPDDHKRQVVELEEFLFEHVYRHPRLGRVRRAGQQRLARLVEHLAASGNLPARYAVRADEVGHRRAAVEYVAGMTERYVDEICRRMGLG